MALNKSSLLIRDYENIRQILRDIYIFGCFSRDDFIEKKGISGRKYDKEQQRINAYLPKKFIQKRRVDKKVLLYCAYSVMDGGSNHLADTYRNKSFTALDVMSFFFVQQLLNESEEMTAAEILDALPATNDRAIFTKDNLRVKLDELVDKGFIQIRKEGRSILYRLAEDIWEGFSDDELMDICLFLEFMKNVSPIEMPYYFLHEKLMLYLSVERGKTVSGKDIFHFKHNHLFNSLDNDILLEILRAMKANQMLEVFFYGNDKGVKIIPIELIHDGVYGRQYLYCLDTETDHSTVIRLDRMSHISVLQKLTKDEENRKASMEGYSDYCWCTSGADEILSEIVIEFRFDEQNEDYILRRIQAEGHGGTINRLAEGLYEYRIKLRDPDEMVPWIRSFGERAKVISSGQKKTEEKVAEEWKKALVKYDSL